MQTLTCQECGETSTFDDNRRRKFCSSRCSKRWRKREQKARRAFGTKRRTYEGWRPILLRDPCGYCGQFPADVADHVVAEASGGDDHWTNLTASCTHCNSLKGHRNSLLHFLLACRERDDARVPA